MWFLDVRRERGIWREGEDKQLPNICPGTFQILENFERPTYPCCRQKGACLIAPTLHAASLTRTRPCPHAQHQCPLPPLAHARTHANAHTHLYVRTHTPTRPHTKPTRISASMVIYSSLQRISCPLLRKKQGRLPQQNQRQTRTIFVSNYHALFHTNMHVGVRSNYKSPPEFGVYLL